MAAPLPLDFQSGEFNIVDDLDDNTGNYRTFDSLDGIITADMRHHEERKQMKPPQSGNGEEAGENTENECCADETVRPSPAPPLTIISRGRLLIISPDIEDALNIGGLLDEQGLTCTVCVPDRGSRGLSFSRRGPFALIEANSVSVSGCFGGFAVTSANADGNQTNLASIPGREMDFFDLVLDLQPTPSFTGKLLPLGYYAPGEDKVRIDEALAELPEMRGRFTKPKFTHFRVERCLHGRSRIHDCTRCLDICPVAAIRSDGRTIVTDPYLCQGCGGCALVCPADAILMQAPPRKELLIALAGQLAGAVAPEHPQPELVLYDRNIDSRILRNMFGNFADNHIFFAVEEIGHIGLDTLLASLDFGAGSVTLICGRERPTAIKQALEREVERGKLIVQELHFHPGSIRFIVHPDDQYNLETMEFPGKIEQSGPSEPLPPPAALTCGHDKRDLIRQAAQHLFAISGAKQAAIALPADAVFGTIVIDAAECSLCMACVGACPSGALKTSGDVPCISMVESHCHQCGLCMAACPEDAIWMQPRLLCDMEAADTPVVIRKEEPFNCIGCGEPFASQAMVSRMLEKLSGHWMYSSERQMERLKMCRTCRTRDTLMTGDFGS
ncbi:MAG: 4Fe-4S binding protein [Desulfobulbaceae bacterium]|nr:4Fe-4S binding protein [Desulfobulbaceae bacterium]